MKPFPLRRRGLALILIGGAFLTVALRGEHHNAFIALALTFFVLGLANIRRAR